MMSIQLILSHFTPLVNQNQGIDSVYFLYYNGLAIAAIAAL